MGATAVLEMAAAIPPAKKSLAKDIATESVDIFGWFQIEVGTGNRSSASTQGWSTGSVEMADVQVSVLI